MVNDNCLPSTSKTSLQTTKELIKCHIRYIQNLETENIKVPDSCYQCLKRLREETQNKSENVKNLNKNSLMPTSSPVAKPFNSKIINEGARNRQRISSFCDEDNYASSSATNDSFSKIPEYKHDKLSNKFKIKNVCEAHKIYLLQLFTGLNKVQHQQGCDICKLVNCKHINPNTPEFYNVQISTNLWNDLFRNILNKPTEDSKALITILSTGVNEGRSLDADTCERLIRSKRKTRDFKDTSTQLSSEYFNNTMSRQQIKDNKSKDKQDKEAYKARYDEPDGTSTEIICKRVSNENSNPDAPKKLVCQINRINKKSTPSDTKIASCSKSAEEKNDGKMKLDTQLRKCSRSKVDDPGKSVMSQRDSLVEKEIVSQGFGQALTATFRCTCEQRFKDNTEEGNLGGMSNAPCCDYDIPVQSTDGSISICRTCGGVRKNEPKPATKLCRNVHTKEDNNLNEAIMKKREEIWGNSIPPDFIIKGTVYANRHADCCVNNTNAQNSNLKYSCPKNNSSPQYSGLKSESNTMNTKKSDFSFECVFVDDENQQGPLKNEPVAKYNNQRTTKRANNISSLSNRPHELDQGRSKHHQCEKPTNIRPSQRQDLETPRNTQMMRRTQNTPAQPQKPKEFVSEVQRREGCVIAFGPTQVEDEDVSDDSCDDDDSDDEHDECQCQKKQEDVKPWYDRLNAQVRAYLNMNNDSDEDIGQTEELKDSNKNPSKLNYQESVLTCILALTPELERMIRDKEMPKDTPQSSMKETNPKGKEMQTMKQLQPLPSKCECEQMKAPLATPQPRKQKSDKEVQTSIDSLRSLESQSCSSNNELCNQSQPIESSPNQVEYVCSCMLESSGNKQPNSNKANEPNLNDVKKNSPTKNVEKTDVPEQSYAPYNKPLQNTTSTSTTDFEETCSCMIDNPDDNEPNEVKKNNSKETDAREQASANPVEHDADHDKGKNRSSTRRHPSDALQDKAEPTSQEPQDDDNSKRTQTSISLRKKRRSRQKSDTVNK